MMFRFTLFLLFNLNIQTKSMFHLESKSHFARRLILRHPLDATILNVLKKKKSKVLNYILFYFKLCVIQKQVPLPLPCFNFAQITPPALIFKKKSLYFYFYKIKFNNPLILFFFFSFFFLTKFLDLIEKILWKKKKIFK